MAFIPKKNHQIMISKQDIDGNTVLHLICSSNKMDPDTKIRYLSYFFQLIQHNNMKNDKGLTVLHMLCDIYIILKTHKFMI